MFLNGYPSQEDHGTPLFSIASICRLSGHLAMGEKWTIDDSTTQMLATVRRCASKVMNESELHLLEGAIINIWHCFGIVATDSKLVATSSRQNRRHKQHAKSACRYSICFLYNQPLVQFSGSPPLWICCNGDSRPSYTGQPVELTDSLLESKLLWNHRLSWILPQPLLW